jgi:ribosome biogenesis SPOUT family RNA methylase Rps3
MQPASKSAGVKNGHKNVWGAKILSNPRNQSALARGMTLALLAGASSMALATGAHAQAAPDDSSQVEEIVVTGIRGSQLKSVDIKRKQTALVDAISAEDIGKLPDITIADSLQRIRACRSSATPAKARRSTSAAWPRSSPC